MYSNRKSVGALRMKVANLRAKINFLKACLVKYTNFDNSDCPLETALTQSLRYFQAQGTVDDPCPSPALASRDFNALQQQQEPIESQLVQRILSEQLAKVK